jgi:hypothetical protein
MNNGRRATGRKTGARIIAEIVQALTKNNNRTETAPKKSASHFISTNLVHKIEQPIATAPAAPEFQASNPFQGTGMQFALL